MGSNELKEAIQEFPWSNFCILKTHLWSWSYKDEETVNCIRHLLCTVRSSVVYFHQGFPIVINRPSFLITLGYFFKGLLRSPVLALGRSILCLTATTCISLYTYILSMCVYTSVCTHPTCLCLNGDVSWAVLGTWIASIPGVCQLASGLVRLFSCLVPQRLWTGLNHSTCALVLCPGLLCGLWLSVLQVLQVLWQWLLGDRGLLKDNWNCFSRFLMPLSIVPAALFAA